MARSGFKLNPNLKAQWAGAMGELRGLLNPKDPQSAQRIVMLSGRRFVKNVVDITPPATGSSGSDAKKRGEAAIMGDLLRLAMPVTVAGTPKAARDVLATAEDLLAAHAKARASSTGRVNPRNRKEKLFTSNAAFNQALTALQKNVGWLAAGLNAAATRLGFSLPAWIKRHGNRFGAIEVKMTNTSIRIRIIQNVPFADNVSGYGRRWDFALKKEIESIRAQIKAIWAKKTARAKARLKR